MSDRPRRLHANLHEEREQAAKMTAKSPLASPARPARPDSYNETSTADTTIFSPTETDSYDSSNTVPGYGSLSEFMTPYLTCSRCNSIVFINVLKVRPKEVEGAPPRKPVTEYEQIPPCPGCGSTRYLRAGVVSFQEQIEEKKKAILEFERKRVPATALLQRIARGFLGRIAFRRRLIERERYLRSINRAATRIQTRVRGMQARRQSLIERCLTIVKRLAPTILSDAISTTAYPDRPPVFWYSNAGELSIFYWNYREFVRRSGGKPSLIQVEKNVIEITKRMLAREYELASRIQARWRGIATRIVFREYKRQRGWWNSIRQSPAIKIQRLFRGHTRRKQCRALQLKNRYPLQRQTYREEMTARQEKQRKQQFRDKLLKKYRTQFQADSTERMMTRHRAIGEKILGNQFPDVQLKKIDRTVSSSLSLETQANLRHSLASDPALDALATLSLAEPSCSSSRARSGAHPNTQRLAQLKRQLEAKSRERGPRLHILRSRQYAPASSSIDERESLQ